MPSPLNKLPAKARRGSKARCHLLTDGAPELVVERLTSLSAPWAHVTPHDKWMPQGFVDLEEATLPNACRLLPEGVRQELLSWWLAVPAPHARTPNWDIASTCMIGGKQGLLLIEAKAHDEELNKEQTGRKNIKPPVSADARRNHARIGWCIEDANMALAKETRLPWALSRDWNYQISNRFTWSWKLAEMGFPVILVYLGFLKADEMVDQGKPFATAADWEELVLSHSEPLFPAAIWNEKWNLHEQVFVPLIRSLKLPLPMEQE